MFLVVKMDFGSVEKYRGARGGRNKKHKKQLAFGEKPNRGVILHVRP